MAPNARPTAAIPSNDVSWHYCGVFPATGNRPWLPVNGVATLRRQCRAAPWPLRCICWLAILPSWPAGVAYGFIRRNMAASWRGKRRLAYRLAYQTWRQTPSSMRRMQYKILAVRHRRSCSPAKLRTPTATHYQRLDTKSCFEKHIIRP